MPSHSDAALFWLGLSSVPGVGRVTFRKLVSHFGSPEEALAASREDLLQVNGISDRTAAAIMSHPWRAAAEKEIEKADRTSVAIIIADDVRFPGRLLHTPDPPVLLYVRGALDNGNAVAIVGTRTPTHYGLTVTHRMAYELAAAGITVVSGMARGIDTQAHKGAIAARGRTCAVLGCGIDIAYPPENRALMEEIAHSGAVVTENPFGTRPEAGYFPARNRIISGLSAGSVIIEAAEDSGSLITADYTIEQGRKLFAVPGNIGSPVSRGPNNLIKKGATLVENAGDVLAAIDAPREEMPRQAPRPQPHLTGDEATIFQELSAEPKHIDVILTDTQCPAGKLGGILITLELKGLIRQLPGKLFVREVP